MYLISVSVTFLNTPHTSLSHSLPHSLPYTLSRSLSPSLAPPRAAYAYIDMHRTRMRNLPQFIVVPMFVLPSRSLTILLSPPYPTLLHSVPPPETVSVINHLVEAPNYLYLSLY